MEYSDKDGVYDVDAQHVLRPFSCEGNVVFIVCIEYVCYEVRGVRNEVAVFIGGIIVGAIL